MPMRRRFFYADEESLDEAPINLTSLIDVVFVIFIAPILNIDVVNLATGKVDTQKLTISPENSPLSILVHSDNSIWMYGKKITLQELEKKLQSEKKLFPHKIPQVIHDKNATFGTYQSIKTVLEKCGFEQMDLVLQPL